MPLAFAVLCMGPSLQAASSVSHGGIKRGWTFQQKHWRESSPCIVTGL